MSCGILDTWKLSSRYQTNLLGRLLLRARIPRVLRLRRWRWKGIAQSGFQSPEFGRCLASKAGYRYMPFSRSMEFTFTMTFPTWIAIEKRPSARGQSGAVPNLLTNRAWDDRRSRYVSDQLSDSN